jgi:hypothetical protein
MAFDWTKSVSAPQLEPGDHKCTIKDVKRSGKNGVFEANDGSPKLLVVYEDHRGAQIGQFFTLNEKSAWVLAKLLSAVEPAIDLAAITAKGITPAHFADIDFARKNLVERQRTVFVRVKFADRVDKNGNTVMEAEPIQAAFARVTTAPSAPAPAPAPAAASTAAARPPASRPIDEDEVPF